MRHIHAVVGVLDQLGAACVQLGEQIVAVPPEVVNRAIRVALHEPAQAVIEVPRLHPVGRKRIEPVFRRPPQRHRLSAAGAARDVTVEIGAVGAASKRADAIARAIASRLFVGRAVPDAIHGIAEHVAHRVIDKAARRIGHKARAHPAAVGIIGALIRPHAAAGVDFQG